VSWQPPAARRAEPLRRIAAPGSRTRLRARSRGKRQNCGPAQVNRKALALNLGSTDVEPAAVRLARGRRGSAIRGASSRSGLRIGVLRPASGEPWSNSIAANSGRGRPIVPASEEAALRPGRGAANRFRATSARAAISYA